MRTLWIIAGIALLVSLAADHRKTRAAVLQGLKMFLSIVPMLLGVLAAVSLVLTAVTPRMLERILSGTGPLPFFSALTIGSIALIPGFIAYPLAALLRQSGASVPVLAAIITSLMMVGILTLPLEARYFSWRAALLRNGLALCGAVIVAVGMSWVLR